MLTITLNPTVDVTIEVDELIAGPKLRSPDARYDPGGGGINVARGIHRFGGEVTALYAAGGAIGGLLTERLEHEGIARRIVPIAETTRESFSVLEKKTQQLYRFVLPGPEFSLEEASQFLDAVTQIEPLPRYWIASGSLPPGVAQDFYAQLGELARQHDARLIVDSSGPALKAAIKTGAYLIKPNQKELAELMGRDSETEAQWRTDCQALIEQGCAEIVVLSLGDQGALLTSREQQLRVDSPKIEARSAVGAGDSFLALLSLRLAQGESLDTALRWAVAAGAAAATSPATELFRRADVERLYRQISEA